MKIEPAEKETEHNRAKPIWLSVGEKINGDPRMWVAVMDYTEDDRDYAMEMAHRIEKVQE